MPWHLTEPIDNKYTLQAFEIGNELKEEIKWFVSFFSLEYNIYRYTGQWRATRINRNIYVLLIFISFADRYERSRRPTDVAGLTTQETTLAYRQHLCLRSVLIHQSPVHPFYYSSLRKC